MAENLVDIKENYIYRLDNELLALLLQDHSSEQNIIWGTDNYAARGLGYQSNDQITISSITGYRGSIIKPRTEKSSKEQIMRIRDKAEVFTPSWVSNRQNNLLDNAWFGFENAFNTETDDDWIPETRPVPFPTSSGKSWQDYVISLRLEISCGEAPYLTSRYDTVSGAVIEVPRRIGLLDRKLRVVSENAKHKDEWMEWAIKSYQSIYGFDWQGDNVLLARENLLFTFLDYFMLVFSTPPDAEILRRIAEILSWNIWQMDGLKCVIPNSCKKTEDVQLSLFVGETKMIPCEGCRTNNHLKHTGIYCRTMDWETHQPIRYVDLMKKEM